MVLSKLSRTAALGSFALAVGRGQAACPADLDPYSAEPNPFGWPLTPAEFAYERTECWVEKYPRCGGQRQSPMDLALNAQGADCALQAGGEQGALSTRASYKIIPGRPAVSVSKYMRGVSIPGDLGTLRLKDAQGRDVEYVAVDAILTTGLHSIDGQMPDAELLIVHERKGHADAYDERVVVSVLFKQGDGRSELFEQLGLSRGEIPETISWRAPQSVDLGEATRGALEGSSLAYSGSMPAPPCTENVKYIVLRDIQQVTADQLTSLEGVLDRFAGGTHKRAPVSRLSAGGVCRAIAQNSVEAPAAARAAAGASCSRWPASVLSSEADASQEPHSATEYMQYRPARNVTVKASPQSLDAHGQFGSIIVNGRNFEAKKVSLKAISSHTVDGHRYGAELIVEHILFGDDLAAADSHASADAHAADAHAATTAAPADAHAAPADAHAAASVDAAADPHSAHRRLETEMGDAHGSAAGPVVRRVLVSVPLKLGRESALLRSLGLGIKAHTTAIRHGNSYELQAPVDLKAGLAASTSKGWYWYIGSDGRQEGCPASSDRWMVFEEPMEVSLEQLNALALEVSGLDSTQPPKPIAGALVSRGFVPPSGSEEHWAPASGLCSRGGAQSPVDIPRGAVEMVGNETFLAKCSWKPVRGLRIENDGARLGVRGNQMGYTTVIGPDGFPKFYQVTEVALRMPSEHMIDGKQFAAELQVIQKNQKTVLEYDDDDAIVSSFFFNIGEESKLLKQLLPAKLPGVGEFVTISQPLDLQWALGPALNGPFYKYDGSYTTPGCEEAVQWAIFDTPMTLSQAQFQAFREGFPMGNTRPLQSLEGRRLLKNSMGESEAIDYKFFLNRKMGRDKRETPIGYIVFPIVGTVLLCTVSMAAIFVREDRDRKTSAGGLEGEASTIGKGYGQL